MNSAFLSAKSRLLRHSCAFTAAFAAFAIGGMGASFAQSQSFERYAPPVVRTDGGGALRSRNETARLSDAERAKILVPQLRGIVIVDQVKKVRSRGGKATGVVVQAQPGSVPESVVSAANGYIGKSVSFGTLDDLTRDLVIAYRGADRPVVNVVIPKQEISSGVVQVLVVVGRLGEVRVAGATNSDPRDTLKEINLERGQPISEGQLLEDLRYLNRNPFRRVDALYQPGKRFGETDVGIQIADDKPWTVYAGVETRGGIGPLGDYRIFEGALAYNAIGLGEILGYQFTHTPNINYLQSHVASLRLPLPDRWELQAIAGYSELRAPPTLGGAVNQSGQNLILGTYLAHPLPRLGMWGHDFRFGGEYKRTNTNLDVAGINVIAARPEVFQGVLGYSGEMQSVLGKTRLEANLYGAPGNVNSNNTDQVFGQLRADARSKYVYSRGNINHRIDFPGDFRLLATLEGQYSNVNLLSTEGFLLGGLGSVRGLPFAIANVDSGLTANVTFYSPGVPVLGLVSSENFVDQLRAYVFIDQGSGWVSNPLPLQTRYYALAGTGVGLSYEASKYAAVDVGYGWNISKIGLENTAYDQPGRWHARVTVRY